MIQWIIFQRYKDGFVSTINQGYTILANKGIRII